MQARLEQEMRDIIGHSFDNKDKKSINLSELEAEVRQLMYKNNLDEDLIVNPFVRKWINLFSINKIFLFQ